MERLENLVERICGNLADPAPEKVGLDGFERLDHLLVADFSAASVFEQVQGERVHDAHVQQNKSPQNRIEPMVSGIGGVDRLVML